MKAEREKGKERENGRSEGRIGRKAGSQRMKEGKERRGAQRQARTRAAGEFDRVD